MAYLIRLVVSEYSRENQKCCKHELVYEGMVWMGLHSYTVCTHGPWRKVISGLYWAICGWLTCNWNKLSLLIVEWRGASSLSSSREDGAATSEISEKQKLSSYQLLFEIAEIEDIWFLICTYFPVQQFHHKYRSNHHCLGILTPCSYHADYARIWLNSCTLAVKNKWHKWDRTFLLILSRAGHASITI